MSRPVKKTESSKCHQSQISSFFCKTRITDVQGPVLSSTGSCITPESKGKTCQGDGADKVPVKKPVRKKSRLSLSSNRTPISPHTLNVKRTPLGGSSTPLNIFIKNCAASSAKKDASMLGGASGTRKEAISRSLEISTATLTDQRYQQSKSKEQDMPSKRRGLLSEDKNCALPVEEQGVTNLRAVLLQPKVRLDGVSKNIGIDQVKLSNKYDSGSRGLDSVPSKCKTNTSSSKPSSSSHPLSPIKSMNGGILKNVLGQVFLPKQSPSTGLLQISSITNNLQGVDGQNCLSNNVSSDQEGPFSPERGASKRKREDPSGSPDIIPGTPPTQLCQNKRPACRTLSSKRRILSSEKMLGPNPSTCEGVVKGLHKFLLPMDEDGNREESSIGPKISMEPDRREEADFQHVKHKLNLTSKKSSSSLHAISSATTDDDGILRCILDQMSSSNHLPSSEQPKLIQCLQKMGPNFPKVSESFTSTVTVEAVENVQPVLSLLDTAPNSCNSNKFNNMPRRSPRKLVASLRSSDTCKTLRVESDLLNSSKFAREKKSPLKRCNNSKAIIENEMADLHTIFNDSINDMVFIENPDVEKNKSVCNHKKDRPLLRHQGGPLRRSPRKINGSATNMVSAKSPKDCADSSYKSAKKDISKVCEYEKSEISEEDLVDVQYIFSNDHSSPQPRNLGGSDENVLDLHKAQVCEVTSLIIKNQEAVLHLKSLDEGLQAECKVRGSWLSCPVFEGDVISIEAEKVNGEWMLDDRAGIIVRNPDLLISGTTVVGSLFCLRRSVLSSLFRGIDSDSNIMVVGSIVHELLQQVLQQQKKSESEIKHIAEDLISSRACVRMLYASKMTKADILKELNIFIPRIAAFMSTYVSCGDKVMLQKKRFSSASSCNSFGGTKGPADWNGRITCIRDIEETFWEPRLGIKGMVDVSVDVEDASGKKRTMPLELKTGKASFSAEHKGQVNLYTMMMSRMGMDVKSGLLLYLREGRMCEVTLSHHERKDLIKLRNTLSEYLLPRTPVLNRETGKFSPLHLPDPINFPSACQKCPYLTLCSVQLKLQNYSKLPSDHPMVSLSSIATHHLSQDHIEYVAHWVGMLQLEDMERLNATKLHHFWRFPPLERERNKRAIVNLQLAGPAVAAQGKYCHEFNRESSINACSSEQDLRKCGLNVGDYIIISTDKCLAVDHGSISNLSCSSVSVLTNKSLFERYGRDRFHIDRSETNTILVHNLTNLGCLLDDNEKANHLRKVIIDRAVPTFNKPLNHSVISSCVKIFRRLNKNQREAVIKTLRADDYVLIKGLPGTGKTATLVALVEVLAHAGLSVLISSHTHSAVDNLLLRLKTAGLQFLRLGSDGRIHPELFAYSENAVTMHCNTPEELDQVLGHQKIVGVTCLGAGHALLSRGHMFDVCLVDESTQVSQPSILRPLFSARRFVLIGDPHQLPPVVRSHQAQELGLSESLFSRLESPKSTVTLSVNYRMNRVITKLANWLTYGGALTCGSDKVAEATLQLPKPKTYSCSWLSAVLSSDIENSVAFIDTSCASSSKYMSKGEDSKDESACSNVFEAQLTVVLMNALLEQGVEGGEIGVIAPYRAQVALLAQAVQDAAHSTGIEVNTVDQFQGRDKQVIIYSCTRSDGESHQNPKEREILNDHRRLTVAITRAKHKLILIGHVSTLKLYAPFKKLLTSLPESNIFSVDEC